MGKIYELYSQEVVPLQPESPIKRTFGCRVFQDNHPSYFYNNSVDKLARKISEFYPLTEGDNVRTISEKEHPKHPTALVIITLSPCEQHLMDFKAALDNYRRRNL